MQLCILLLWCSTSTISTALVSLLWWYHVHERCIKILITSEIWPLQ